MGVENNGNFNSDCASSKVTSSSSSAAAVAAAAAATSTKFTPAGIYRPPAARKAIKLNENNVQLAPAAASETAVNPYIEKNVTTTSSIALSTSTSTITTTAAAASPSPSSTSVTASSNKCCSTSIASNISNINENEQLSAVASQGNPIVNNRSAPSRPPRERRPDRAVYIPRARRSQTTPPSTAATSPILTTTTTPTPTSPLSTNAILSSSNAVLEKSDNQNVSESGKLSENVRPVIRHLSCEDHDNSFNVSHNLNLSSCNRILNTSLSIEEERKVKNALIVVPSVTNCDFIPKPKHQEAQQIEQRQQHNILVDYNSTNKQTIETMNKTNKTKMSPKGGGGGGGLIIGNNPEKVDKDEKELRRASQEMNRSNRRIIKQTFPSNVLEIDENISPTTRSKGPDEHKSANPEEDDWEAMFDDNGDCLDPKLMDELTTAVGKVTIETPRTDYKLYQSKQAALNDEEFPHVLEVSNFPIEFKTQDLMMIFSPYKETGFDIKWVDDTHALAVFSSSRIAAEVLAMGHPFVRVKPLAEATVESRSKARKCSSSLQPYRPRPETCAALARRLVTTALGVRLKTAPEERENERRVLREAKERKLLAAKQRDEIWES